MSGSHATADNKDPVPGEPESTLPSSVILGEVVLWRGRPDARVVFMPADLVLIPFSVLWAGMGILIGVVSLIGGSRMPTPIAISIIVVFGLAGLYLLVGRFVVKAILNTKTSYVVTTTEAIVTRGTTVTRFPLQQHTVEINRTRRGGHATVYFGDSSGGGMDVGNLGLDFLVPKYGQRMRSRVWKAQDMTFYNVADGLAERSARGRLPAHGERITVSVGVGWLSRLPRAE